jgi:hypothetical protein
MMFICMLNVRNYFGLDLHLPKVFRVVLRKQINFMSSRRLPPVASAAFSYFIDQDALDKLHMLRV